MIVLSFLALLSSGVLAGEELVVRWGVQPALRALDDRAHVAARVALVRRLRIVVPAVMVPTVVLAVAATVAAGASPGLALRLAGLGALLVFLLASFLGTVPINMQVIDWDAAAPPADWRALVRRWQRIDVLRSSAALAAFALLLGGMLR